VARAVGDDEVPACRVEVSVGHVNRDALLALGCQAIGQQREIQLGRRLRMLPRAVARQGGHLIVREHARIVEQSPQQAALAIIHAAAGDEAQHFVRIRCRHQK